MSKEKRMRTILSEDDALDILRRNRVKMDYPKITLPAVGPGLGVWKAIDCLANRFKYVVMPRELKV